MLHVRQGHRVHASEQRDPNRTPQSSCQAAHSPRNNASRWSSGQDVALSRRNQGFDSPTGYQHESASIDGALLYWETVGKSNPKGPAPLRKQSGTVFRCRVRARARAKDGRCERYCYREQMLTPLRDTKVPSILPQHVPGIFMSKKSTYVEATEKVIANAYF